MNFKYLIVLSLFWIYSCGSAQELEHKDAELITAIVNIVQENHLSPKAINDDLSKQIFHSFLQKIDPDKKIFISTEINQLKSSEVNLDDELKNKTSHFFNDAIEVFSAGIIRAEKYANKYLGKEIEIFTDEYFESDKDKIDFANEKDLEKRWQSIIKKQFIEDLYIIEIVNPDLTFEEQKSLALEKTTIFFRNYFYDTKSQTREKLFEIYLNAYVSSNDYQSQFLSPQSVIDWNNSFNRTFVGVGLSIETTMDYPVIKDVLYNGPAWNTKRINKGDLLMKVSNKENELIDVAGFPLKKIIGLLKGEKGTSVNVRIKNAENKMEDIAIERGQVFMSQVMSFVLEDKKINTKIGYIYIPRFYVGADGCASHVLRELRALKEKNVEGIIIDLRNNHGGSSTECNEMIGYFLEGGKVMQSIYADGDHNIFDDQDESAQFSGKLVVLVNERSGSASELFSGTLQDYHRAIIVGSQTFGKGTMQNFFNIGEEENSINYGRIKLSVAKFYTGNGRSNQYNGIIPDIEIPTENRYLKTGERAVDNALIFKNIEPSFDAENTLHKETINQLATLSLDRQSKNNYFQKIEKKALFNQKNKEASRLSLNYNKYKLEKEAFRGNKAENKGVKKFNVDYLTDSKREEEKIGYWKLKLEQDEYIYESMLIMHDYLQMNS